MSNKFEFRSLTPDTSLATDPTGREWTDDMRSMSHYNRILWNSSKKRYDALKSLDGWIDLHLGKPQNSNEIEYKQEIIEISPNFALTNYLSANVNHDAESLKLAYLCACNDKVGAMFRQALQALGAAESKLLADAIRMKDGRVDGKLVKGTIRLT